MQIQCPQCKEWIEDEYGTCPLCSADLYPLDTCHSKDDNPELKAYVKQKREARIQKIWKASLAGTAFLIFIFGAVLNLWTPMIIAIFTFWILLYRCIDNMGNKKILVANKEIPPKIRRFKTVWFASNGIIAFFSLLIWLSGGCRPIEHFLYSIAGFVWWKGGFLPMISFTFILILGTMIYHPIKMSIADKAIEKKCITDQSKQKCPHCQKWTDSENETCMFCNHSLVDNKYQLEKFEDENGVIDWSLLDKKTAQHLFRHHPDRKVYYMGKLTTCGEIHKRDFFSSMVILSVSLVLLLILTLVLL